MNPTVQTKSWTSGFVEFTAQALHYPNSVTEEQLLTEREKHVANANPGIWGPSPAPPSTSQSTMGQHNHPLPARPGMQVPSLASCLMHANSGGPHTVTHIVRSICIDLIIAICCVAWIGMYLCINSEVHLQFLTKVLLVTCMYKTERWNINVAWFRSCMNFNLLHPERPLNFFYEIWVTWFRVIYLSQILCHMDSTCILTSCAWQPLMERLACTYLYNNIYLAYQFRENILSFSSKLP